MDKMYTQNNLPIIDPLLSAEFKHVELEQIKKRNGSFPGPDQKVKIKSSPLDKQINRIFKRAMDIFLSLLVIICVLSWLIPIMAILIKINSKGPVFFLQKRAGLYGKIFTCIKFRTMFMNTEADSLPEQENDNRITSIGKFLRTRHIDELPQFINVLMGDMSIIGPRPYMITENIKFENLFNGYSYRYTVKPGITGYAQSNGNFGGTMDVEKLAQRLKQDHLYIQHWTPAMDAKILARTFKLVAKKD